MNSEPEFKEKFTTLFESHPDAVYLQTPEGKILDCNTSASKMTGYSKKEILKLESKDIFQDDMIGYFPAVLKEKDSGFVLSNHCMKKDGGGCPVSVDIRSFTVKNGSFVFVTVRDMTSQNNIEIELEKLKRQLKQTRKMEVIGLLAGGITHYYNNIFTGIIGALDMAKRDASGELLPLLRRAEKVANLASGFTRRLLTFTRESRDVMEPADIGGLIDDVEDFARNTFDRRIKIEVKKPDNLDPVLADPVSLHHLLLNLLVNARDALIEKQLSVTWEPKLSITVEAQNILIDDSGIETYNGTRKGRYVRVSVADTGCGMDEETQKHVFEPFFTTKEAGKGTGFGLATAASTAKQYGGWIELASKPGKGSTFTVYLPATTLKKTVTRKQKTEDLPCGTETILLVDDDEMIRTLGTMTLERQGYTVLSAENGKECLDIFLRERKNIDLIILDLLLPVLSGREALEKIRRIDPGITVIISTGHDFETDKGSFDELRADDYILKPFNIADLVLAVRNVLDRKRIKR